jgi:uncharacterized DUF497 family protein
MLLEWDDRKNLENFRKHGLRFEDADTVLTGETVTLFDNRFDYGEERFVTLGVLKGEVVTVIHTLRGEMLRIISMRKGSQRERKIYQERHEKGSRHEG